MTHYSELPRKHCLSCGVSIRRKEDSVAYQSSICFKCIRDKPDFIEIKRKMNALRQQKYYERHAEEEKERARQRYAESKE